MTIMIATITTSTIANALPAPSPPFTSQSPQSPPQFPQSPVLQSQSRQSGVTQIQGEIPG